MRVVVAGAGPKGLQALSQLVAQAAARRTRPDLEVHLVDPRPAGTGAAYAVDQPDWLRLNVRPGICHLPPLLALPEWAELRGEPLADDVPRSTVGRYLAEACDALVSWADFPVRVHRASVTSVRTPAGGAPGFEVTLDDGGVLVADQVLLATGHAPDWPGALAHAWQDDAPLVASVYPVAGLDAIPPGSRVAVRGAALTFIDLALHLTEGRERERWPSAILPTGRSGALLAAKPAPLADPLADPLPAEPLALLRDLALLAGELLGRVRGTEPAHAEVAQTLATGWEPNLADPFPGRAVAALERSLAVLDGRAAPGAAWALGRTWAVRYPDVVQALSGGERHGEQWQHFLRTAAVLERFTFGPPVGNARRLLQLCRDGIVDCSWLDAGVRIDGDGVHGLPGGSAPADVVVDAVLPPPGARDARNPLLDTLLEQGILRLAEGRRGIAVDPDGFAAPGLALVGRPLEDVVVGNDTLSRTLHDVPRRWARRVLDDLEELS